MRSHPALFVGAMLALAGCESDSPRGRMRGGPNSNGAVAAAAAAAIPEMEAQGTFFKGQIEAEVLLNRAGFAARDAAAAEGRGGGGGSRGGGFRGGFGGGGGGGGRRGGGGRGGGGNSEEMPAARTARDDEPRPNIHASNEPPVRLHLRLTNHGAEPVDVEVTDFDSDLGNFVVQPAKVAIPPGGSVDLDPMTSRLGVKADEIPLVVAMRVAGQKEKQTLTLKVKPPAATPPTPAPATSP